MKKICYRTLSLLLVVVLCIGTVSTFVFANEETEKFIVNGGTYRFQQVSTGKYMTHNSWESPAPYSNGGRRVTDEALDEGSNDQIWPLRSSGDGYRISPIGNNDKYLNCVGADYDSGDKVNAHSLPTPNLTPNSERFKFQRVEADGSYQLISLGMLAKNLCVACEGGEALLKPGEDIDDRKWYVEAVEVQEVAFADLFLDSTQYIHQLACFAASFNGGGADDSFDDIKKRLIKERVFNKGLGDTKTPHIVEHTFAHMDNLSDTGAQISNNILGGLIVKPNNND